jgi:adenosylcobinamide-phosphate synthase
MEYLQILALAIVIELIIGDPPDAFHPVAWVGRVISFFERFGVDRRRRFQFFYGLVMTLVVTAFFTAVAFFLLAYLKDISEIVYVIVGALLLKSTFSFRGLGRVAHKIGRLLEKNELNEARFELRALVSRDTRNLSQTLLVSATVESVAESTGDSFVSPLFFFLLFGVPGAVAFRVVSNFDSMIGYHGKYEYLGKFASRLDDVLNFIPARLAGLMIVVAAFITGAKGRNSFKVMRRDASKTESPNAGWPMAAMAGALDIQLEKVGQYKLGQAATPIIPKTINTSLKIMQVVVISWIMICFLTGVIRLVLKA